MRTIVAPCRATSRAGRAVPAPTLPRRATGVALLCAALAAGSLSAGADEAEGVVSLPRLLEGPSGDLTGDVDAAMAEDGTGGVVYLRRQSGRAHVFAVS